VIDPEVIVDLAIGLAVVAALAAPALLSTRAFFGDWGNHLYMVDQQTRWLRDDALPTYFLHSTESGVFYPHYLFYGGSLYAVSGWLGTLVGSVNAYRLTFVLAFTGSYFGTLCTARQIGVRRFMSHIPATLAVSSAYFVSKAYYDGGWPEFIAVSMIPVVAATSLSILRSRRVSLGAASLLVASTFLLTGSHSITVACGLLFLSLVAAIVALVYRGSITRDHVKRFGIIGALVTFAAALNGWFIVPLAQYASTTFIGRVDPNLDWHDHDYVTRSFDSWRVVFSPLRSYPVLPIRAASPFYVQAPVYALAWLTCVGVLALLRRQRSRTTKVFFALIAVLSVLFTLLLWQGVWDYLPSFLKHIQFRYRLHTYINYTVVGLVIVGLLLIAGARAFRAWFLAIFLAATAALGLGIWQAWSAPKYLSVDQIVKTSDGTPRIDYADCPAPCRRARADYRIPGDIDAGSLQELHVNVSGARTGETDIRVPPGGPYRTNIAWSPLIELEGARIIGATGEGWAVVAPTQRSTEAALPATSRLRQRTTGAVVLGRVVSGTAAATLVIWLMVIVIVRVRRRRLAMRFASPETPARGQNGL
jgi:hypothetical protein